MKNVKKHTQSLGTSIKQQFANRRFPIHHISKIKSRRKEEQNTMLEMWENYLGFASMDF